MWLSCSSKFWFFPISRDPPSKSEFGFIPLNVRSHFLRNNLWASSKKEKLLVLIVELNFAFSAHKNWNLQKKYTNCDCFWWRENNNLKFGKLHHFLYKQEHSLQLRVYVIREVVLSLKWLFVFSLLNFLSVLWTRARRTTNSQAKSKVGSL